MLQNTFSNIRNLGCKGDPSSPLLFNLYLDLITNLEKKFKGVAFGKEKIVFLLYADDIIILSNSSTELNKILKELVEIAMQIGLHFAENKCKVFVNKSQNRSKAKIYLNGKNINKGSGNIEYLGATLNSRFQWSPNKSKIADKIKDRLKHFKPKNLKLNTIRVVLQSKVNSIPRYLATTGCVLITDLTELETKISGTIKKKMGWDIRLSKAVIYGKKEIGGFGLTSTKDIYTIEKCSAIERFTNSTSSLTKAVVRRAILRSEKGLSNDKYYEEIINIYNELNWNWVEPRKIYQKDNWKIISKGQVPNIREGVLEQLRSKANGIPLISSE